MKALVIYDSQYGNTARIAEAIGRGIAAAVQDPATIEVVRIAQASPHNVVRSDILVVGSPTQKFRPTSPIQQLLKSLPKNALRGVKVAAFDTRLTEEEINSHGILTKFVDIFGCAAQPIADELAKKGGQEAAPPAGFYVAGSEGPRLAAGRRYRYPVPGPPRFAGKGISECKERHP